MADKKDPLPFSVWRKIAMASWRPRKDPAILATIDQDAGRLLEYLDAVQKATGVHVTPMHLVGRASAKVFAAMPGLNGRVVFGRFLASPTVDGFFVVSLRTDPVAGGEAVATDLSGAVVRRVDEKTPWQIAIELAERAGLIRGDEDPLFKQTKAMVKNLPPMTLRLVTDLIGFFTESLQVGIPLIGLEARPYGSFLVSNVGTYGLDAVFAPIPPFAHPPVTILVGTVTDKVLAVEGEPAVRPVLPLAFVIDHRFVDGYQAAAMAKVFRLYLSDPARFDPLPATPRRAVRRPGA